MEPLRFPISWRLMCYLMEKVYLSIFLLGMTTSLRYILLVTLRKLMSQIWKLQEA